MLLVRDKGRDKSHGGQKLVLVPGVPGGVNGTRITEPVVS